MLIKLFELGNMPQQEEFVMEAIEKDHLFEYTDLVEELYDREQNGTLASDTSEARAKAAQLLLTKKDVRKKHEIYNDLRKKADLTRSDKVA